MQLTKTILYISYDGMTDPLGQSQVIPYLKGLASSGIKIIILSFEKKKSVISLDTVKHDLDASGILWKPFRYHKSPTIPATLYDIFIGTIFTFIYCKKFDVSVIHCRSYIAALMAHLSGKFLKVKTIFDMRGFWADERVEGNIWDIKKPVHRYVYKFFKKKEKKFINEFDQVVTLTYAAKKYIEGNFNPLREIKVIPCSTDLLLFQHVATPPNADIKSLDKANKFRLIYLGSTGTWYLLDKMFAFFKVLNEIKPAVFIIVTTDLKERIYATAGKLGVDRSSIIIKSAKRNEIPSYLSYADAGIFFIKPVFSKTASSPVKHGEMLACGLPVIANSKIGDLDAMISETNSGIILRSWSKEAMVKAANELIILSKEKNKDHFRAVAEKYFSLEKAIQTYQEIYNKLTRD